MTYFQEFYAKNTIAICAREVTIMLSDGVKSWPCTIIIPAGEYKVVHDDDDE